MTTEQAIYELKDLRRVAANALGEIPEKALSLAIDALGKAKPQGIKDGHYCGNCECGKLVFCNENFCSKCGQALDWGDYYDG